MPSKLVIHHKQLDKWQFPGKRLKCRHGPLGKNPEMIIKNDPNGALINIGCNECGGGGGVCVCVPQIYQIKKVVHCTIEASDPTVYCGREAPLLWVATLQGLPRYSLMKMKIE